MTADEAGLEAKSIPLSVHAGYNLGGIDTHAVENHGKFVHEGDINVAASSRQLSLPQRS